MAYFDVEQVVFLGQHIREYPAALANSQEDALKLHAKCYTPRNGDETGRPDLTIVGFGANAFPKETYEPFYELLCRRLENQYGLRVGSIWIADQVHQGESALINDGDLGNDPHWFDHSRDIISMINTFRSRMTRPIVAIGHSMGGAQIVATSHFHPRLFEAVVLMDPPLTPTMGTLLPAMLKSMFSKPASFASREEAEQQTRKNPLFRTWHPQVLQRFLENVWHDGPTALVPEGGKFRSKTTLHAEISTLTRPNVEQLSVVELPKDDISRSKIPDMSPEWPMTGPVYNPWMPKAYKYLGDLRPSALFLLGKGSKLIKAHELEPRTRATGTEVGGSGGVDAGKVGQVTIPGGHFLPFTNPEGCADEVASWLVKQLQIWSKTEENFRQEWDTKSTAEKQRIPQHVDETLRTWNGKPWPKPAREDARLASKL